MTTRNSPLRKVSVVIPVLNQADELSEQLRSILHQDIDLPFEVVVADNGSSDASVELVAQLSVQDPRVKGVDASARAGPAAARNIGVASATGDALVFCDADDVVAAGWLAACLEALQGADVAAGWFDFSTLNGGPSPAATEHPADHFAFLPAGLGANLAVRAVAFAAVGGFDEALRVGEDFDLCWRLQLAGHRLVSTPGAVVAKRERHDPSSRRRQQFSYGRHDARLYRKFRAAGMPRNFQFTLKTWAWLVLNAPLALVSRRRRVAWSRAWFLRLGRLLGSIEQRVFYP